MKNKWNLLLLALACACLQCSDEKVQPTFLEDDLVTSATLYEDRYLSIDLTTIISPIDPGELPEKVAFDLQGTGGKVSVNWGDGTIEKLIVGASLKLEHQYAHVKNYTVRVSGDLNTITFFSMSYLYTRIHKIHFGGLINLKGVDMFLMTSPSVINLSRNRSIEHVSLFELGGLTDVLLPTSNKLNYVDLTGAKQLTTAVVDRIIARVHDSVVNKPRAGTFGLGVGWGEDSEKVGPPSSYSINKLRKLRDVYGWTISPDVN